MREGIGVNTICSQVLQHLAYHTFTGGDVACQPDDIFPWPAAQRFVSLPVNFNLILTLRLYDVKGDLSGLVESGTLVRRQL